MASRVTKPPERHPLEWWSLWSGRSLCSSMSEEHSEATEQRYSLEVRSESCPAWKRRNPVGAQSSPAASLSGKLRERVKSSLGTSIIVPLIYPIKENTHSLGLSVMKLMLLWVLLCRAAVRILFFSHVISRIIVDLCAAPRFFSIWVFHVISGVCDWSVFFTSFPRPRYCRSGNPMGTCKCTCYKNKDKLRFWKPAKFFHSLMSPSKDVNLN